ncbi:DUF1559 domain-containing protein [Lacipirellula sp.]|uniref:DUF1559 family PulG-like putative transporter n=1 Tax=Lacipirellula sp. TaxID=2691419 RepID=UPI003D113EC0
MKFRLGTIAYVFALLAAGMATFGAWGIARAVGVMWFWLWTSDGRPRRRPMLWGLGAACIVGATQLLLPTATPAAYRAVQRQLCLVNLKFWAAGIREYASANGTLPPVTLRDPAGKPLHSWRTLVLPYLDLKGLYGKFDLRLPWDDSANAAAAQTLLEFQQCPADHQHGPATSYFAVVGPRTAWPADGKRKIDEITDGASNTILLMEAPGRSVDWAEPRDLSFDEAVDVLTGQGPRTGSHDVDVYNLIFVVYADGRLGSLSAPLSRELATALLTIDGGEAIDKAELVKAEPRKLSVEFLWGLSAFVALALWPGVYVWRGVRTPPV